MNNVVDRAKNIVVTPKTEWAVVDAEPASVQDIYTRYLVPLALIPAVAGFIGMAIVGISIPGLGTIRTGFFASVMQAILQFGVSLAMVYLFAVIIDALAPTFGGQRNPLAAFKVSAYSMTPAFLAGIFSLIPALSFLGIVGLYAIYLLYLGLPRLMRAPDDKAVAYTAVVVVAAIALWIVIFGILAF
ncbi:MAG TPA: Yip1 family protein, partial [Beijerinckiaceae bacterium]|nr:Yip1 family protein [Beijerinckiaceae bacterium]